MPRHLTRRASVAAAARGSAVRSAVVLSVCLLGLTGCTSEPPVTVPEPTSSSVTTVVPTGDGVLRIGTLFPMTGVAAAGGAAQVAGAQLAARSVGEEGGIPGRTIELIHRDAAGDVAGAVAEFVARGVDVVFWDAAAAPVDAVAASVTEAGLAFLALGEFANGGTPLAADEDFTARLRTADPGLAATAGGAEAYDGLIVTALAATAVGDDAAASVEIGWERVAAGPTVCGSWGECAAALVDVQSIEYQGLTGVRS